MRGQPQGDPIPAYVYVGVVIGGLGGEGHPVDEAHGLGEIGEGDGALQGVAGSRPGGVAGEEGERAPLRSGVTPAWKASWQAPGATRVEAGNLPWGAGLDRHRDGGRLFCLRHQGDRRPGCGELSRRAATPAVRRGPVEPAGGHTNSNHSSTTRVSSSMATPTEAR